MRLILGTVIDTYMDEAQEELRSKRVKQSKGLMRAFSVLDYRNEGALWRPFRMLYRQGACGKRPLNACCRS